MMMMSARLGLERSLLIPVSNMSCLANAGSSSKGRISRYVVLVRRTMQYQQQQYLLVLLGSLRFHEVDLKWRQLGRWRQRRRGLYLYLQATFQWTPILVRTTNPTCLLLLLCSCVQCIHGTHAHTPGDVLPCVRIFIRRCCRGCVMLDVIFRQGLILFSY